MEFKAEKFELTVEQVEALNALFPENEPVLTINAEQRTFDWAKSRDDSIGRLEIKLKEMGKA